MKNCFALLLVSLSVVLSGCDTGPKSSRGFTLPDGDPALGKAAFIELRCHSCHQIAGIEQLTAEGEKPKISVKLGGKVTKIKTYGELVTSVINPSHRLAKGYPMGEIQQDGVSKMRNYNDVMTVRQLVDLVAFLQSEYELMVYDPTRYRSYNF